MKLIDLLVKELPKRGGWPDGADRCRVDNLDGDSITVSFCFPKGYSNGFDVPFQLSMTISTPRRNVIVATDYCMITRDLYESVLAASQKPAWNGEGVPPVGVECESKQFAQIDWREFRVVAVENGHVFGFWHDNVGACLDSTHWMFRPLRTESERKRESALESICAVLEMVAQDYKRNDEVKLIYEAIAAGKIPGVKLDD